MALLQNLQFGVCGAPEWQNVHVFEAASHEHPMTLARKTVWSLGALTGAMFVAGSAAVWCLLTLQNLNAATREEFEELREIRPVEGRLWTVALLLGDENRAAACDELDAALASLDAFRHAQQGFSRLDSQHGSREQQLAGQAVGALESLRDALRSPLRSPSAAPDIATLVAVQQQLNALVNEFERAVATVQVRTTRRFQTVLVGLVAFFAAVTAAAAWVSFSHYRSVIGPLRYVRDAVRTLARGALHTRLAPRGDAEFRDLQADFNQMAGELESSHRDLEQRVAQQGRRLAVSERLASVGFLAAGVAHEINNPLAIMSGHAQSLLRRLRQAEPPDAPGMLRDLEIIRDEAFRAKQITQQLLDLSRGGDPRRIPVSLWRIVTDVTEILRETPAAGGTSITATGHTSDPLTILASEPEIRQVVLNLALNAAHAVQPEHGAIHLHAERSDDWVELQVRDNGCGMTRETLERVFEPFFTGRNGRGGVGLGLTISHAIVRRHGGELLAASDGPGRGSVFTLRLPASRGEHQA